MKICVHRSYSFNFGKPYLCSFDSSPLYKMETPLFDRMHKIIYLKIIALMPIFDRKRPFSTRILAVEDTPKTLKNTHTCPETG